MHVYINFLFVLFNIFSYRKSIFAICILTSRAFKKIRYSNLYIPEIYILLPKVIFLTKRLVAIILY